MEVLVENREWESVELVGGEIVKDAIDDQVPKWMETWVIRLWVGLGFV